METLPSRISSMPCPFAGDSDAAITIPGSGSDESTMNFHRGFGANYGAPGSNGGKYVTRDEMNGLGRVATQDMFYHKCGGLNTFDPDFAAAVGGYPKGAVLDYLLENRLYRVLSLVSNNQVDFRISGIDNKNWTVVGEDADPGEKDVLMTFRNVTGGSQIVGMFESPINGIVVSTLPTITEGDKLEVASGTYGSLMGFLMYGSCVLIKEIASEETSLKYPSVSMVTSPTATKAIDINLNGWTVIGGDAGHYCWFVPSGNVGSQMRFPLSISGMTLKTGHKYAVAYWDDALTSPSATIEYVGTASNNLRIYAKETKTSGDIRLLFTQTQAQPE